MIDLNAKEVRVNSWDECESIYNSAFRRKRGRWYFRGHPNADWPLETSLERLLARVRQREAQILPPYPSYPDGSLAKSLGRRIELVMLRAFQARASKFLPNLPAPVQILEWLALMRHWGLPSRLLDVTTSPYVALYFALCDRLQVGRTHDHDAAVWGINHIPIRATSSLAAGVEAHVDLSETSLFIRHFVAEGNNRLVAPVHPQSHNERLAAQQGTFLCVSDVDSSFSENILATMTENELRDQDVAQKLVISQEMSVEALGRLSAMNIHRASLFPDLDGYSRFINESLVLFGFQGDQYEPHLDFESLERLGWLG